MSPPKYIAAIEVDKRQAIIHAADKLKEILGGSWTIEETRELGTRAIQGDERKSVWLIMPVSGQLWLAATDENTLRRVLWRLREEIVEKLDLPTTFAVVEVEGNFDSACRRLEERVRELKDAKAGEDGRVSLPHLAHCLIQPDKAANHWYADWGEHEQHKRRALASNSTRARAHQGRKTLNHFLENFKDRATYEDPDQFEDLVVPGTDSFLALIKADADGMGRVNSQIEWTKLAPSLPWDAAEWGKIAKRTGWEHRSTEEPWRPDEAKSSLCWAVDDCLQKALQGAVNYATEKDLARRSEAGRQPGRPPFPIAPMVASGEDIWILCRRDLALKLALDLGSEYAKLAARHEVLNTALRASDLEEEEALTLSLGILFAKNGYPFEIMSELAEDLLKNAKKSRANTPGAKAGPSPVDRTGWVDYYWLDSTGREHIIGARASSQSYKDGTNWFRLFTRPWRLGELGGFVEAAKALGSKIPRSKWAQLHTVLALGQGLSDLAYRQWFLQLGVDGQENLKKAVDCLAARLKPECIEKSPWTKEDTYWTTPLLELSEVVEITNV